MAEESTFEFRIVANVRITYCYDFAYRKNNTVVHISFSFFPPLADNFDSARKICERYKMGVWDNWVLCDGSARLDYRPAFYGVVCEEKKLEIRN